MITDDASEFLAIMRRIDVGEHWLQKSGTSHEYLDICMAKRSAAIVAGEHEITRRELGHTMAARRAWNRPAVGLS